MKPGMVEIGQTKVCSVCGQEKPIILFPKRAALKFGVDHRCKKCDSARSTTPQKKKYDTDRLRRKQYWKLPKNKKKLKAVSLLNYAVKTGKIKREPCFVCENLTVDGHHPDHDFPYIVIWLCRKCHVNHHRIDMRAKKLLNKC